MSIIFEKLSKIELPRWPKMALWGDSVTEEQAKDILFRTEPFFTDTTDSVGGSNIPWNHWAQRELGYAPYTAAVIPSEFKWKLRKRLQNAFDFVETSYVFNDWASSCFGHGPHGWCSPTGKIFFQDNVGKEPNAQELYRDWKNIAEAFPYLKLTATFMSGEQCEDDIVPVFSLVVAEGEVALAENAIPMPSEIDPGQRKYVNRDDDPRKEQGVPDEWILQFGQRTKPVVRQLALLLSKEMNL